jgi:hypothetical protein
MKTYSITKDHIEQLAKLSAILKTGPVTEKQQDWIASRINDIIYKSIQKECVCH